jgi:UDP:flavonoid glycosyltransferase YjiC (YdhE family)
MRCRIVAVGSRGDVQPLIALGAGLKQAGLDVRVATHEDFAAAVQHQGLAYAPLEGRASSFFGGAAGHAFREGVKDADRFRRFFDNYLALFMRRFLRDAWEACADADLVITWSRTAPSLADRLRVPVLVSSLNPVLHLPTAAFANPFQGPTPGQGTGGHRRSWRLATSASRIGHEEVQRWRREVLGLPETSWRQDLRHLRRLPHLLGYSEAVLPRPSDWAPWIHVTGYWFLDDTTDTAPDPRLQAFVDQGPPPVAIGFSSQVGPGAVAMTRAIVDAVERAGVRAVLITGFGGLRGTDYPASVHAVSTVPYHWLLPRIRGLVHHGGAGSTAAALRLGVPSMAVPFGFDQELWGAQLHRLGVGPAPLPAAALTAETLAQALRTLCETPSFAPRARAVAQTLAREDGIDRAVQLIRATCA